MRITAAVSEREGALRLREQGRFPIERFVSFYDFGRIEQAARDAAAGTTIKPVLRFDQGAHTHGQSAMRMQDERRRP